VTGEEEEEGAEEEEEEEEFASLHWEGVENDQSLVSVGGPAIPSPPLAIYSNPLLPLLSRR